MTLWISERNISTHSISSAGIWSIPGDLYLFNFERRYSTSTGLGSGTNGSAVRTFYRPNITSPMYIPYLREVVLPPIQNNVEIYKITVPILYQVRPMLVTLLKFIYSSILVSSDLVLTVWCKLINFVFQIFLLFVPEMSASFASYIVHIIPIYLARIL
jgi:hypothetical protein